MNLGGRTVLLTGASGGLGQAIARGLATRGASLVLTGRRLEALEPLAAELRGRAIACDLADEDALERLVDEAGTIDVLVANAGVPASGMADRLPIERIDRALDTNLRAPIVLTRMLAPGMAERGGGHIVYVNSTSGKTPTTGQALYSATKFGLRGFARGVREDLRAQNIGVSSVYPAFIRDAGMWHDTGVKLPFYIGLKAPGDVARAVVRAIESNKAEIDVAPILIRAGSNIQRLAPELAATVQRRLGASDIASRAIDKQQDKR